MITVLVRRRLNFDVIARSPRRSGVAGRAPEGNGEVASEEHWELFDP